MQKQSTNNKPLCILAIETSCDETAIALIESPRTGHSFRVLSNIVLSQIKLHEKWGGVVPNLAKREHQKNLPPLLLQALSEAGFLIPNSPNYLISNKISKQKLLTRNYSLQTILQRESELLEQFIKHITPLQKPPIDIIAVTQGPGLEPALWVGVNFARALSVLWGIPLVGINHMEGHVFSALVKAEKTPRRMTGPTFKLQTISYPALALLVSGGHTELVLMRKPLKYEIIGETRDDAAGEAFDKVARILKLGYPGGPHVAACAQRAQTDTESKSPRASALRLRMSARELKLPRPMMHTKDFDFSFSGLKTAVLYLVRDLEKQKVNIQKLRPAICKEFQDAVVEVLVAKTIRAAETYKVKTILLGGGVAANSELRKRLSKEVQKCVPASSLMLPGSSVTGDNALMIAVAALMRKTKAKKTAWKTMKPNAGMRLAS